MEFRFRSTTIFLRPDCPLSIARAQRSKNAAAAALISSLTVDCAPRAQAEWVTGEKIGSSPISGERCPELEEEVVVIAEAVGPALDDFDLVVDALDQVGPQGPSAVREDAWQVAFEVASKCLGRLDAASHGPVIPLLPESLGVAAMPVVPQRLRSPFIT